MGQQLSRLVRSHPSPCTPTTLWTNTTDSTDSTENPAYDIRTNPTFAHPSHNALTGVITVDFGIETTRGVKFIAATAPTSPTDLLINKQCLRLPRSAGIKYRPRQRRSRLPERAPLPNLPAEIVLKILENVDVATLWKFRATSRDYRKLIDRTIGKIADFSQAVARQTALVVPVPKALRGWVDSQEFLRNLMYAQYARRLFQNWKANGCETLIYLLLYDMVSRMDFSFWSTGQIEKVIPDGVALFHRITLVGEAIMAMPSEEIQKLPEICRVKAAKLLEACPEIKLDDSEVRARCERLAIISLCWSRVLFELPKRRMARLALVVGLVRYSSPDELTESEIHNLLPDVDTLFDTLRQKELDIMWFLLNRGMSFLRDGWSCNDRGRNESTSDMDDRVKQSTQGDTFQERFLKRTFASAFVTILLTCTLGHEYPEGSCFWDSQDSEGWDLADIARRRRKRPATTL